MERVEIVIMVKKTILSSLLLLLILGCDSLSDNTAHVDTAPNKPTQVINRLVVGHYSLKPPKAYWYFPRKYPQKKLDYDNYLLITFWETKEAIADASPGKSIQVFFNFGVFENKHDNYDSYYKEMKSYGIIYEELPKAVMELNNFKTWSCKTSFHSMYSIECITLIDNLVGIGILGSNKSEVLAKSHMLRDMIESFTVLEE